MTPDEPGRVGANVMRFEWEGETLRLVGNVGWREATCPSCGKPIRWVLDMLAFTSREHGGHSLVHARCAWKPEAFRRQEHAARLIQDRSEPTP